MRDLSNLLWCDLQTDREKLEFIRSGRAVDTGILAPAMVEDLVEVYRRIADAVVALETITRHEIDADIEDYLFSEPNKYGNWVRYGDVETVLAILRGNSPTNSEGSE